MPFKNMKKQCVKFFITAITTCLAWGGASATSTVEPLRDSGVLTGDPDSKFRNYFWPTNEIQLATPNAKLFVGANINADLYWIKHAETLDASIKEDERRKFRQRTELYFLLKYGINNEQERSAVDARITLANILHMRTDIKASSYHSDSRDAIVTGSRLDDNFSPIKIFFKEAWFQFNLDRCINCKKLEDNQHFIRVGYFQHLVGRGISLGDSYYGGINYMGFGKTGIEQHGLVYPPGILWHGQASKYAGYNLYFSPLVVENIAAVNRNLTYIAMKAPDESLLNRHIIAADIKIGAELKDVCNTMANKDGCGLVNPYWVYYNSPRHSVERGADAPTHLHTFGVMAEVSAGGFEVNVEAAKQYGRQTVRARVYSETSPGGEKYYPSIQHFDPTTGKFRPLPASVFAQLPTGSKNPNRWFTNDDSTATSNDIYWVDQSNETRLAEYHPAYDLKLNGWMLLGDMRYTFANYPLIVAAAFGYFSGGSYPYNDVVNRYFASKDDSLHTTSSDGTINLASETEKDYNGFMPVRDQHYVGLWVYPLVLVNAGIIPRPKQMDLFALQSHNDSDTLTNLVYAGAGITVRPLQDRNKLRINANVLAYWLDDGLKKWDKRGTPPVRLVGNEGIVKNADNTYSRIYDTYHINGWVSDNNASKYLGWELNTAINYRITHNLELSLRGGIFFPGQVYVDIADQPNDNTQHVTEREPSTSALGALKDTLSEYKGLGQDKTFGVYLRVRYVF